MTNNNSKSPVEFVREKCGGLTLQHVLRKLVIDQNIERIDAGHVGMSFESILGNFVWDYFIGPSKKIANFQHQDSKTREFISKLLGFSGKEGGE